MDRRVFLKSIAGYGLASSFAPAANLLAHEPDSSDRFGLHPFIEAHPEAVFIRRTNVASKTDGDGIRREAHALASRIFILRDKAGIPLNHKFSFKPNLTSTKGTGLSYAIVTDPFAVEGLVERLKQMGIAAGNIYVREGLMVEQPVTGFSDMARRQGIHYGDSDSRTPTLKECPDGVVFRRTKYLGPFNYPDSYLINVCKFKTHSMGLTLCVKNLQGTNIPPYIRFCGGIQNSIGQDFQPDAAQHVEDLYLKHREAGIPRWATERGQWMEMWAHRTIDHYSLIKPNVGLNIIEGVYAQNGDAFDGGPGRDGTPEIFMTNVFIFGRDAFRVDIIGHWLAGHEPGNFGLFHLAKERGASRALNPRNIPVYSWEDSGPELTPLDKFTRTPLATPYLPKPGESRFHMCDEPFAYPAEPVSACLSGGDEPSLQVLGKVKQANTRLSLVLEYSLPADGYALLEIYNRAGERVGMPVAGRVRQGVHMASWSSDRITPGIYASRLRTQGTDRLNVFTVNS